MASPTVAPEVILISASLAFGLDADQNIRFTHIVAEPDVPMFGITDQQFASVQSLNRGLVIQLKLSDRVDILTEKLDSDRQGMMPGEDIQNTATHRELATSCHLGRFFISALQEAFAERVPIEAIVAPQDERLFPERLSAWNRVLQR